MVLGEELIRLHIRIVEGGWQVVVVFVGNRTLARNQEAAIARSVVRHHPSRLRLQHRNMKVVGYLIVEEIFRLEVKEVEVEIIGLEVLK
jgi:hypothetical protein